MSQRKTKYKKHIIKLTVAFIIFISCIVPTTSAYAANAIGESGGSSYDLKTLTGGHKYPDLYSSIIYSMSNGNTADSVSMSYEKLATYPAKNDELQIYGRLKSTDDNDETTIEGKQLSNYLATLYEYNWIMPVEKDSNIIVKLFNKITGAISSAFLEYVLWFGALFASLFDNVMSLISTFQKGISYLDIPTLLGVDRSDRGDNANKTLLNKFLTSILDVANVSPAFINALKGIFWIFIAGAAALALIVSIQSGRKGMSTGSPFFILRKFAIQVIVIMCVAPMSIMITKGFDTLLTKATNDYTVASDINNSLIVDTLAWAATENLSLSAVNPNIDISSSGVGKADENFKPTQENILKLTTSINSKLRVASAADGSNEKELRKSSKSASALLDAFISKDTATVNDYLSMISAAGNGSGIAASVAPTEGTTFDVGDGFNKARYNPTLGPTYFMTPNTQYDEDDMSEHYNDDGTKKESDKDDDDKSDSKINEININGSTFPVGGTAASNAEKVSWNSPTSYIYGAVTPTNSTDANANYVNYINGPKTYQNKDTITGENGMKGERRKSMFTNSAGVALMNRYAGITKIDGGASYSLSTQSVAFLLQTYSDGKGGLTYYGYNTFGDGKGSTKITSKNGNRFIRYVIPNTGKGDLLVKVNNVGTLWTCAGITAVFALLQLLRAPVFGALFKSIILYLRAQLTGDLIAALSYLAYRVAIGASFTFATIGVYLGAMTVNQLMPKLSNSMLASATMGAFMPLLIAVLLCWPVVNLRFSSSKKDKKVSMLGLIVMIPYLLAEAFEEMLWPFYNRLYGKSKGQTFSDKLTRKVSTVDQSEHLKSVATGVANVAKMGATVATGGAIGIAGMAASMASKDFDSENEEAVPFAHDADAEELFTENGILRQDGSLTNPAVFDEREREELDIDKVNEQETDKLVDEVENSHTENMENIMHGLDNLEVKTDGAEAKSVSEAIAKAEVDDAKVEVDNAKVDADEVNVDADSEVELNEEAENNLDANRDGDYDIRTDGEVKVFGGSISPDGGMMSGSGLTSKVKDLGDTEFASREEKHSPLSNKLDKTTSRIEDNLAAEKNKALANQKFNAIFAKNDAAIAEAQEKYESNPKKYKRLLNDKQLAEYNAHKETSQKHYASAVAAQQQIDKIVALRSRIPQQITDEKGRTIDNPQYAKALAMQAKLEQHKNANMSACKQSTNAAIKMMPKPTIIQQVKAAPGKATVATGSAVVDRIKAGKAAKANPNDLLAQQALKDAKLSVKPALIVDKAVKNAVKGTINAAKNAPEAVKNTPGKLGNAIKNAPSAIVDKHLEREYKKAHGKESDGAKFAKALGKTLSNATLGTNFNDGLGGGKMEFHDPIVSKYGSKEAKERQAARVGDNKTKPKSNSDRVNAAKEARERRDSMEMLNALDNIANKLDDGLN